MHHDRLRGGSVVWGGQGERVRRSRTGTAMVTGPRSALEGGRLQPLNGSPLSYCQFLNRLKRMLFKELLSSPEIKRNSLGPTHSSDLGGWWRRERNVGLYGNWPAELLWGRHLAFLYRILLTCETRVWGKEMSKVPAVYSECDSRGLFLPSPSMHTLHFPLRYPWGGQDSFLFLFSSSGNLV